MRSLKKRGPHVLDDLMTYFPYNCSAAAVDEVPIPLTTYDASDDTDADLTSALEHFVSPNLDDVKSEAVSLVCKLRANSSIPYNIVPRVIQSFNDMASSLTHFVHSQFASSMINSGIDRPTVDKVSAAVSEQLQQCYSPLSFFINMLQN